MLVAPRVVLVCCVLPWSFPARVSCPRLRFCGRYISKAKYKSKTRSQGVKPPPERPLCGADFFPSVMAPGGCCSFRHQRKWIASNVLASFTLCGSAIFLYVSIAPLAAKLNCAILCVRKIVRVLTLAHEKPDWLSSLTDRRIFKSPVLMWL